jgi:hypothetical protein
MHVRSTNIKALQKFKYANAPTQVYRCMAKMIMIHESVNLLKISINRRRNSTFGKQQA